MVLWLSLVFIDLIFSLHFGFYILDIKLRHASNSMTPSVVKSSKVEYSPSGVPIPCTCAAADQHQWHCIYAADRPPSTALQVVVGG